MDHVFPCSSRWFCSEEDTLQLSSLAPSYLSQTGSGNSRTNDDEDTLTVRRNKYMGSGWADTHLNTPNIQQEPFTVALCLAPLQGSLLMTEQLKSWKFLVMCVWHALVILAFPVWQQAAAELAASPSVTQNLLFTQSLIVNWFSLPVKRR